MIVRDIDKNMASKNDQDESVGFACTTITTTSATCEENYEPEVKFPTLGMISISFGMLAHSIVFTAPLPFVVRSI